MKKYFLEIIILILQLLMFYIYPLIIGMDNPFVMVLTIILVTFILSIIIGRLSNKKIKHLYPLIIAILFIPSVYIYYNESALVHSVWYFIVSISGVGIGTIMTK